MTAQLSSLCYNKRLCSEPLPPFNNCTARKLHDVRLLTRVTWTCVPSAAISPADVEDGGTTTLTDPHGYIASPLYPTGYPKMTHTWAINVSFRNRSLFAVCSFSNCDSRQRKKIIILRFVFTTPRTSKISICIFVVVLISAYSFLKILLSNKCFM